MIETARAYRFLGYTYEEIAQRLGVSDRTFYRWLKERPELRQILENAGELADGNVAMSLYQRAVGMTLVEIREGTHEDEETGERTFHIASRTTREQAPDTQAALAWLQNRQPGKWKARSETDHNVNLTVRRALLELGDD